MNLLKKFQKIGSVNNLINNAGDQIVDHLINVKKKI